MRYSFLFALLLLSHCRGGNPNQEASTEAAPPWPALPAERIQDLAQRSDYIDYVFYYANFSLSQDEPEAVRQAVSFIGSGGIRPKADCKPMGRIFFQEKGDILLQGDMYFQEGCYYFLFLENDQPKYAHAMSPGAQAFFRQIFQQAGQRPYPR